MQLQQLDLQRQQLEMQRQAMELQQKAAEAQAQKANAEANQKPVITDAQCSNGVCVPKAAPELVALPAKTPAQICRDCGFNWYGYCADTKAEQ
jgi:hypothetical protein